MRLLSPAGRGRQERREVAGNGESLRNVSRRERRARGTRRNAQTKTRGEGKPAKRWGPSSPLKKKSNSKKVAVPYTRSKTRFFAGRKRQVLSHINK